MSTSTVAMDKADLVELRQALLATDTVTRWVLREGFELRDLDLVVANTHKNHLKIACKERLRVIVKKLIEQNPDMTEVDLIRGALERLPDEVAEIQPSVPDKLRKEGWTEEKMAKITQAELLQEAIYYLSWDSDSR